MKLCRIVIFVVSNLFITDAREFFFRHYPKVNDPCVSKLNSRTGKCSHIRNCLYVQKLFGRGHSYDQVSCSGAVTRLVCCPMEQERRPDVIDVSPPSPPILGCGKAWNVHTVNDLRSYYSANKTAEDLLRKGFRVTRHEVIEDRLIDFVVHNSTYFSKFSKENPHDRFVTGGKNARKILSTYMALIGDEGSSGKEWYCDGVLINWEWVLTAAHCFRRKPEYVRLGEYDLETTEPSAQEDPQDYTIKRTVIYPDYRNPGSDHDLALIQLSKPTFIGRPDINPVCLPWGSSSGKSLIGKNVILTGWGATRYRGLSSSLLQEATIKIFHPSVCQKSYSTLRTYQSKFPTGIKSETHICAGTLSGGVDACQGDSGGPIVYHDHIDDRYYLAGIVSTGNGCGLKGFPGLYVPINNPKYLSWIKKEAFSQ